LTRDTSENITEEEEEKKQEMHQSAHIDINMISTDQITITLDDSYR